MVLMAKGREERGFMRDSDSKVVMRAITIMANRQLECKKREQQAWHMWTYAIWSNRHVSSSIIPPSAFVME